MMNNGKCEALQAVNEAAFVLQELVLYLDTHPTCTSGLARYQQARECYRQAVENYVLQYGPLQIDHVQPDCSWQWVQTPWPWEMED